MKLYMKAIGTALLGCTLLMTGCSNSTSKDKTEEYSNEKIDISKLETNINKLHNQKVGKITEDISTLDDTDIKPYLKEMKDTSYNGLLSTFHQDYESPEKLMDKLNYNVDKGNFGDGKYTFKDNLNILILLDASGSMGKQINGETQMQIAKQSLRSFLQSLPNEANVGLRVYGYEGTGTDDDKEKSCSSSKLFYGLEKFNNTKFEKALSKVHPAGWTPTELALNDANKDLSKYNSKENTNIVYLVSDGISTCDDKPVEAAKRLVDSNSNPVVNVIGFNVDAKAKKQLVEISNVTNGQYKDVGDSYELSEQFKEVQAMANKWKTWLKGQKGKIDESSTFNVVDIFNYAARQQKKSIIEKNNIDRIIHALIDTKKISESEGKTLLKENKEYHSKIEESVAHLKADLQKVNQESYSGAVTEINQLLNGK